LSWADILSNASLGAIVVLARRSGHADGPDHLIAGLDRQAAGERQHARVLLGGMRRRITHHPLEESGRRRAERSRRISLAVAALRGVQAGTVAAQHHQGQTIAVDHGDRNLESHLLASIHGTIRDHLGHRQADILFGDEALRMRR
jgi:hypothetical protein